MDGFLPSSSSSHSQETSSNSTTTRSGLTLVLPSLKNLKATKAAKKSKAPASVLTSSAFDGEVAERKTPRPVKLKPLKEVLTKLIQQIKKKDDYAFFLEPVDPSQAPGYLDTIRRPMDFGTMTHKVIRGKYRSLEEFANDLKLVTTNSKIYNPPGSIYYTEADRIEVWALDHIAKAASTVIQYETDWNIDIEKDDVNIDDDDDDDDDDNPLMSVHLDDVAVNGRSLSVASQMQQSMGRRGLRGPNKKNSPQSRISDSIDSEGRLPGSREGIGAFPPCSDWTKTMVALKLKGKRYKTKKERLRIEKEGPPYLPDGSLDYTEMEDPFSFLSALVPDPMTRPHLIPVYPPLSIFHTPVPPPPLQSYSVSENSTPQPELSASTSVSQVFRPSAPFPSTISLPLNYNPSSIKLELPPVTTYSKRRHWHITRNPPGRKGRDNVDDSEIDEPPWHAEREAHPVDFGSFAVLAGALSEEMKKRGATSGVLKDGEEEQVILNVLRDDPSLETRADKSFPNDNGISSSNLTGSTPGLGNYFSSQRAAEAEDYIRDVIYGGVEGFAYVRSLAEFVGYSSKEDSSAPVSELGLGKSLNQYVRGIVDELTEGRHSLLSETARQLQRQLELQTHSPLVEPDPGFPLAAQTATSLNLAPTATTALQALLEIRSQKIDMGALINKPEELFLSEEEWAGKGLREKRKVMMHEALARKRPKNEDSDSRALEFAEDSSMQIDGDKMTDHSSLDNATSASNPEAESPEELAEVLDYAADLITELNRRMKDTEDKSPLLMELSASGTSDTNLTLGEDAAMRNLRLNLLALAKRAPLDTIARLPLELVPEHIRPCISTLDTSIAPSPSGPPAVAVTPAYVPSAGTTSTFS